MKNIKKFFYTILNGLAICYLWMGLEYLLDGEIVNRPIDNIIMMIMLIYIWFAVSYFVDKKEKSKE